MYKKVLSKQQESNASVYEAVGKMFLGNAATGRNLNPAALSLITKTVNKEQDPEYEELLEKPEDEGFYDRDEICNLLHIAYPTLRRIEKSGILKSQKVGRKNLYSKQEVNMLIKSGKLAKYGHRQ